MIFIAERALRQLTVGKLFEKRGGGRHISAQARLVRSIHFFSNTELRRAYQMS